jgi:hypothetical protein
MSSRIGLRDVEERYSGVMYSNLMDGVFDLRSVIVFVLSDCFVVEFMVFAFIPREFRYDNWFSYTVINTGN